MPALVPATSVEVRDRDGALLRAYTAGDGLWRLAAPPRPEIDPGYLRMLVTYEDRRFADHAGVDPRAILRAGWQALRSGRVVSGASTLTMQVARLLENSGTGQWRGKLRQARLALALERRLDKAQILNLYLTLAPYGGNIEGLRAATLSWLGKEPTRLTPAEAAFLVALPQSPEARRPDRHPRAARTARDRVLQRMHRAGVIDASALAAALSDPLPQRRRAFPALAPHLSDRARAERPEALRHDLTLDADLQARLEGLAREALRGQVFGLSVAVLVANHRSGAILASVGSAGLGQRGQGFVDMTQAVRSPGSTLKPLIYALAFDRGLAHPETLIDDRPTDFAGYAPQNFDGVFRGRIRVADALRLSLNLPAVLLTEALGPANLMAALRRADVTPRLSGPAGLAVALGGVGMSLRDLVQLYSGLAQGGQVRALHHRQGTPATAARRLTSAASAWQVGHVLADLPPPGGAPVRRIAWKTGTSYGHRDAWAIGYDGAHVIGVWLGRPDGTPVPGAFGADLAAPLLFQAFDRLAGSLTGQASPLPPPPPETLLVGASLLPEPLRQFRRRTEGMPRDPDAPALAFPPDGVRLPLDGAPLPVRVRDGRPPFTWLVNGAPVLTGQRGREAFLPGLGPGFTDLTVIDAAGRSARAQVRLDP
nr:penicillin-binding protein 1C [Pseudooceanicola aestuarii]